MKTTFPDELCFYLFESPFGVISVFYKDNPFMLAEVMLKNPLDHKGAGGGSHLAPWPGTSLHPRILDFFNAYFDKKPVSVPWDLLMLDRFTPLQRMVWEKTADIDFGNLCSYGSIAEAIGRPGAARFVGTALGRNPFPVIIPCHRVIRKNGNMGGFGSGIEMKRKMIAFEGGLPRAFA